MINRVVRKRRKLFWRWLAIGAGLAVLLLLVDYFVYPWLSPFAGKSGNRGENGLWLRDSWYFGHWTPAELQGLAQRLTAGQIRFAYCHVRYMQADGQLHYRFPQAARRFTDTLHRAAPGVRALAWIYVSNQAQYTPVDLRTAAVRQRMVAEARWLVTTCGFDGVQWDYEVCPNNDAGLLALLRETRTALPAGSLQSVCTPLCYPSPLTAIYGWTPAYFAQVGACCDQVVVMAYDSALVQPRGYVWLVSGQTARVTAAVYRSNPACRGLIGVPTYREASFAHHPHAENLRMALEGVREGLRDAHTSRAAFAGVAIFADYTTTSGDWATYRRMWLAK